MSKFPADLLPDPFFQKARVLKALGNSPVSESWLLQIDGMQVVLRRDKELAQKLCLDRESEWTIMRRTHEAGFGPRPLWRDQDRGLLLKEYVTGPVWTSRCITERERLRQLGNRLQQLHASGIKAKAVDIEAKIGLYKNRLDSPLAEQLASEAALLAPILDAEADAVICHNDLGFQNIVGYAPAILIDWEYAGLGSPWFDIAGVCCQNALSFSQIRELLIGYPGLPASDYEDTLTLACRLYDLVGALWYLNLSQELDSRPRGRMMLKRALERVGTDLQLPRRGS
jgi:thiamine kinase